MPKRTVKFKDEDAEGEITEDRRRTNADGTTTVEGHWVVRSRGRSGRRRQHQRRVG